MSSANFANTMKQRLGGEASRRGLMSAFLTVCKLAWGASQQPKSKESERERERD